MTLGERLREIRQARGWSTRESAEASGLSLTYISDLEHGRGNPTLDALLALSRGYDMTLVEILYSVTFENEGGRSALPFEEDDL